MAKSGGPSLRDDLKQVTRRKLVDAARECFEDKGYVGTSAEDIASMAGASRATFYLHFAGKYEILAEVVEKDHISLMLELVETLGEMDSLSVKDIRAWLDSFSGIYQSTRRIMRAWIQAGGREGSEFNNVADAMRDRFLDVMTGKVLAVRERSGVPLKRADAEIASLLMFIEIERFCYYVYLRKLPVDREAGLDLIARRWYDTLTGT